MAGMVPLNVSSLVSRDAAGTIANVIGDDGNNNNYNNSSSEVLVEHAYYNPRLLNGVVVALLMAVGLLGNGLVLYVYHFKMPRTVFSTFVTVLAALDLTTALVGMPIDVVFKTSLLPVLTGGGGAAGGTGGVGSSERDVLSAFCKLVHFEVYSSSLASGGVLLLITVTRHSKVCRPLEPGLGKRKARVLCGLICLAALLLSTVTLVINGLEPVRIAVGERDAPAAPPPPAANTTTSNRSISLLFNEDSATNGGGGGGGTNNSLADDQSHVRWTGGVDDDVPAGPGKRTEVVRMYICRTSEEQKGTALYYALQAILMTALVGILLSLLVLHCRISSTLADFERRRSSMRRFSAQDPPEAQGTHITASMFRIFATITGIFAVSYLPHLACLILEKALVQPGQTVSQAARVAMDLAYNFPYINVVANPFIYGYRSPVFRKHCLEIARRVCRCLGRCCGVRETYR